jgi:hypothetical protein
MVGLQVKVDPEIVGGFDSVKTRAVDPFPITAPSETPLLTAEMRAVAELDATTSS